MSRTIVVQIVTDHDDTEQAAASLLAALRREGYDYVDWRPFTNADGVIESVVTSDCHAALVVGSITELENLGEPLLAKAWPEPQISPPRP